MPDLDVGARRLGRPPNVDGAETRARLLDAALDLFATQGYAATTVREVAEVVGIRDSAIYSHFDGKRAIYDALLDRAGPGLPGALAMDASRLAEGHPASVLPEFVRKLVDAWDEPDTRRFTSLMLREGMPGVAEALSDVREQLALALGRWADRGLVRDDVDPDLLAWELSGPLAAVRLVHLCADSADAQRDEGRRLAARHAEYFVDTVVTDPTRNVDVAGSHGTDHPGGAR